MNIINLKLFSYCHANKWPRVRKENQRQQSKSKVNPNINMINFMSLLKHIVYTFSIKYYDVIYFALHSTVNILWSKAHSLLSRLFSNEILSNLLILLRKKKKKIFICFQLSYLHSLLPHSVSIPLCIGLLCVRY